VEPRKAETREVARAAEPTDALPGNAPGDDVGRFLRELRQLRDIAGLGLAELAARAHYPYDVLKSAEAGPKLPDLPVLSAYVRGCGGTIAEWEERWRSLTRSPASPLLPTRAAGCSDAASAGARIGISAPPDGHDPARIMAALDRVADGMAAPAAQSGVSGPSGSSGPSGPAAVPGMRLPSTSDAAQPGSVAGPTPAAMPELARLLAAKAAARAAAGTRPSVVSALAARTARMQAARARGTGRAPGVFTPRTAITVLVAIALFLVGLVLILVR
jgi:hypothetical protein